jgi:hypothetical protein
MSIDIMIDLETLGTTADAVIVSIGAVAFNLDAGTVLQGDERASFYVVLDTETQPRRHISADTLAWWMCQSDAARAVFDRANPVQHHFPARTALSALNDWVRQVVLQANAQHKDLRVWSNGADFDLPMLAHACRTFNVPRPWLPYAGRCYRTYKNLPGARQVAMLRGGVHHNALDDAIDQAQHLCAIHAALFSSTGGAA